MLLRGKITYILGVYSSTMQKFKHEVKVKVKLSLCFIILLLKHYATKTYGGVGVISPLFFTSKLDGGEWSASRRRSSYILGPEDGTCVSEYSRDSAVGIATCYGLDD
jgi:hypothetical protein